MPINIDISNLNSNDLIPINTHYMKNYLIQIRSVVVKVSAPKIFRVYLTMPSLPYVLCALRFYMDSVLMNFGLNLFWRKTPSWI